MVVEGIHVEDIFGLVSLVHSLIISWAFRILAHEEDQYTVAFWGHHKYKLDVVEIQVIVVAMQVRPVEIRVNVVELHLSSVEIHVKIVEKQVSAY